MKRTIGALAGLTAALTLGFAAPAVADDATHEHDPHTPSWVLWQPTAFDTCTTADHDRYKVVGPDGKSYDSWHPTSITTPDGKTCTFGHEHGDDPSTSRIYDWVKARLAAPGHEAQAGIPFGYVSQASVEWESHGGTAAHRHEDHPGHKVIVLNDVKLVHADRTKGYVRDAAGKPVTCDYLMKMHQGSHSPDATHSNAHELIYGMRCSNGAEAVVSVLTKLGQPNEFHANCDEHRVTTSGSNLPAGTAGRRLIPTTDCVKAHKDVWGMYELWETDTTITAPDGHQLIHFDPWFGVRNPSRVWDTKKGDVTASVLMATVFGEGRADGVPWYKVKDGTDKTSPESPFNGAKRDSYVAGTEIHNAGGPTTWYTDPYGGNASTTPFPGAVKQYIANVDTGSVDVGRQVFGWSTDYGAPGSKVHAPN
ncbi:MAG: hypothetical protein E7A62_09635 [Actinomycetaceae bacterium]|nr:hypothetical protein [Actinomycetaceae bacterium]MDU0971229.1 hypothetical protein [Actinomycetaceae bacterium]